MANDPFEYVTLPLEIVRDMVAIPRERYEALMAVQRAAETYYRGYAQDEADEEGICGKAQQDAARDLRDSLAALRAAGIQTGDR